MVCSSRILFHFTLIVKIAIYTDDVGFFSSISNIFYGFGLYNMRDYFYFVFAASVENQGLVSFSRVGDKTCFKSLTKPAGLSTGEKQRECFTALWSKGRTTNSHSLFLCVFHTYYQAHLKILTQSGKYLFYWRRRKWFNDESVSYCWDPLSGKSTTLSIKLLWSFSYK